MHAERLLKLAQHLETGKLGHDRFDFNYYNAKFNCGTAGCAIGECPTVFPDDWILSGADLPIYREARYDCGLHGTVCESGMAFFEISRLVYEHLFIPLGQRAGQFGGETLTRSATKEQVAANIRAFVAKAVADAT